MNQFEQREGELRQYVARLEEALKKIKLTTDVQAHEEPSHGGALSHLEEAWVTADEVLGTRPPWLQIAKVQE